MGGGGGGGGCGGGGGGGGGGAGGAGGGDDDALGKPAFTTRLPWGKLVEKSPGEGISVELRRLVFRPKCQHFTLVSRNGALGGLPTAVYEGGVGGVQWQARSGVERCMPVRRCAPRGSAASFRRRPLTGS